MGDVYIKYHFNLNFQGREQLEAFKVEIENTLDALERVERRPFFQKSNIVTGVTLVVREGRNDRNRNHRSSRQEKSRDKEQYGRDRDRGESSPIKYEDGLGNSLNDIDLVEE